LYNPDVVVVGGRCYTEGFCHAKSRFPSPTTMYAILKSRGHPYAEPNIMEEAKTIFIMVHSGFITVQYQENN
jgi:hypothetical protein